MGGKKSKTEGGIQAEEIKTNKQTKKPIKNEENT